jgi:GNAT superfamily N-acetyltransferase
MTISIRKINSLSPAIDPLEGDAEAEGYDFVEALVDQWARGENRFDRRGEVLLGCFDETARELIGVGGLNIDPFAEDPSLGRIRKVYIRPGWRNQGIGRLLVSTLVERARKSFRSVRLRAENANAARLYERLGFVAILDPNASHILRFDQEPSKG